MSADNKLKIAHFLLDLEKLVYCIFLLVSNKYLYEHLGVFWWYCLLPFTTNRNTYKQLLFNLWNQSLTFFMNANITAVYGGCRFLLIYVRFWNVLAFPFIICKCKGQMKTTNEQVNKYKIFLIFSTLCFPFFFESLTVFNWVVAECFKGCN